MTGDERIQAYVDGKQTSQIPWMIPIRYARFEKRPYKAIERLRIWWAGVKIALAERPPKTYMVTVECGKDDAEVQTGFAMVGDPVPFRVEVDEEVTLG